MTVYSFKKDRPSNMKTHFEKWDWFRLSDLFDIKKGKRLTKEDMGSGITPFIGSSEQDNGVTAYINHDPIHQGNTISVTYNGSVAEAFYQPKDFWCSDDVNVLYPKFKLDPYVALFFTALIKKEKYRFSYGRKWHMERMAESKIKLPVDKNKNVALDLIEDYMKGLCNIKETINNLSKKHKNISLSLSDRNWEWFLINDLFDVSGTKTTPKIKLEETGKGEYPYVTTQSTNNGVGGFYNFFTENGNVLVIDSAVAGFCSYQEKNFSASDHVEKLSSKFKLNKYIGLFLQTIINLEQFRYSYGKKFNQEKIRNTKIKLPIDKNGNPDWQFMEDYIKSLPYSASV